MFARVLIPALLATLLGAALMSPGCDPCPKCFKINHRVSPTPTGSVGSTPSSTPTSVPSPTGSSSRTATPTATATVAPGAIGGAPVGSITVLLSGGFAPSSAIASTRNDSLAGTTGGGVTAYIPDGDYGNGIKNIEVVPVSGTGPARATIVTSNPVNSCSANQNTGEVVCTDNVNGIYLINGNTLSATLTSSGVNQEFFSGGACTTCGVVVDTPHNRALISIANNVSPTPSSTPIPAGPGAFQAIDLSKNTLSAPIKPPATGQISESFGLNTGANQILSADEQGFFDIIDITNLASPIAYQFAGGTFSLVFDTTAIDSTGIAIAGVEGTGNLFLADLSQATFSPNAKPRTWAAPNQVQTLPEFGPSFGYFGAGLTGMAIATGTNDIFLEDEFGFAGFGAGIGAIKLPATGGSGTPAVLDWVVAHMPSTPDGGFWNMPLDPHGLTAARANVAISNGQVIVGPTPKGIGFVINDERTYLGIVDLDALLAGPRAVGDSKQLDPNYAPLQNNVIAYVPVNPSTTQNFVQNGDFNDGKGFYSTAVVAAGSTPGFPNFNVLTSALCIPIQIGNPYFSLNVPNGADGYFQQQVTFPAGIRPSLTFMAWGNVSAVTATVSVVPSTGPAVVVGSFTPPLLQTSDSACSTNSPQFESFSLSSFSGQTVTIRFEAASTGTDQAIANFDSIVVN